MNYQMMGSTSGLSSKARLAGSLMNSPTFGPGGGGAPQTSGGGSRYDPVRDAVMMEKQRQMSLMGGGMGAPGSSGGGGR
jgi:hypothetical protein